MSGNAHVDGEAKVIVKQAFIDLLRRFQMTTIFGNPGSTELAFLNDLPGDIRYVLGLQEASVVGMADGYSQITGKAAFVNVHSVAGLGNALGNIYTASKNQSPLVIVAGQQTRDLLPFDPYLGAERATEFPRPHVKWASEPARAGDVPIAFAQAYCMAMQRPRGPVFLSVPADDWTATTSPVPERLLHAEFSPDQTGILDLAKAISASSRPALVYGAAVDRDNAYDLGITLAERIDAPVWQAPVSSRSSFPEKHRLFAGFLPAFPERLSESLKPYDLIIVIGAPVFTFHVPGNCALLHSGPSIFQLVDDAAMAARSPRTTSILGTMRASIRDLIDAVSERPRTRQTAVRQAAPTPKSGAPPSIEYVMHTLSLALPDDTIVVEEATSHRLAMQRYLPIDKPESFFTMASGGLGYGLPAAVGIALSRKKHVVCLLGDGAAMYSLQALWTAAQHQLPLTVIILNNGEYGAMLSFSRLLGATNEPPGIRLPGINFEALAAAFGVPGTIVTQGERMRDALQSAMKHPTPYLLDVRVDSSSGDAF